MDKRFSLEQLQAIETSGNVIVSAGAGSGKTTVMVERVVKKLIAGNKLEKMLLVTFTRASAADIRVKLAERLTRLKREEPKYTAVANEALEALPVCNIGTLHSFCQRLIRAYYYAAGVDPAATLADEQEARSLKLESIRRAVRAARSVGDEVVCDILDALSGRRDDEGAIGAVEDVLDYALSLSDTRGYLSQVDDDKAHYGELDDMTAQRKEKLLYEAKLLNADMACVNDVKFKPIVNAAAQLFGYIEHGFEVAQTQYRGVDQDCKALNERFKTLKGAVGKFREDVAEIEKIKKLESAPYARAVCAIALDALDRYEARKTALGRMDYSDLEHGALKVLSDADCMREISKTVDFVFIDEYQDVNPLQAEIAKLLKDEAKAEMFLVGDIKQSIYAFRRCNPKFFKDALDDPDYTKVLLNRNYRSSAEVIDFINEVFTGVMSPKFGGADYNVDKLICGSKAHGMAEFYALPYAEKTRKTSLDDEVLVDIPYSVIDAPKGVEQEDEQARFIVDSILDYMEKSPESGLGSVAVLMRSTKSAFCDGLIRLMQANGIACKRGKKSGATDYAEVQALLGIARCLDNRFDDVALYTALRSPMGGFGDDELLEIATEGEALALKAGVEQECGLGTARKSYYFWQKVRCYSGKYSARLCAFFARRDELAAFSKKHDAADSLGRLTSEIDFFQYVFENGGNAAAVDALIAAAATKKCSLSSFLQIADDIELDVGDGGDAVTVSTIHASKGLEYDFVIVADIGRRFNKRDWSSKCMTADGGVAVKYPDAATRELKPAARWLLEKTVVPDRMRAEELRLFYVALTRAKKKLIVCGRQQKKTSEPEDAAGEYGFMKNMIPQPITVAMRASIEQIAPLPVDSAIVDAVRDRLCGGYAPKDTPIKTCVTAIAERGDDDYTSFAPVLTYDDREGSDVAADKRTLGGDDAARRGTAYHRAMELIDFDDPDVQKVKSGMGDHELVDFDCILAAASEMKKLTAGAKAYYKERYFIADMPIAGENTLVQGVIDLLIINADGTATIVDYKTTSPEYLLNDNYLKQLSLYAAAVEKSAPLKVTSTYLYSFVLGKSIKCDRA